MQQKTINTILVSSVLVFAGVGIYTLFRKGGSSLFKFGRRTSGSADEETSLASTPEALSDEFVKAGLEKSNALLQNKRKVYEAKWKKSGTKLSFKDWYIANAE